MKYSFASKELFEKISMDKTNYKLIILIIASVNESYNLFVECWKEYMNNFPEVKAYFLYSDPELTSDVMIYDNIILYKTEESLVPGIFQKTVCAMNFCQKYFSYEYIIRTNLSTFLHIPRLLEYLSDKPRENFIAGHYNQLPNAASQLVKHTLVNNYLDKTLNEKFIYIHGTGIILSHDVTNKLLSHLKTNYDKIQSAFALPDDVLISLVMYDFLSFDENIDEMEHYQPKEFINIHKYKISCRDLIDPKLFDINNNNIFLIRNKINGDTTNADIDARYNDIMNYIHQIRYFYNKPSFMDYIDEPLKKKVVDCFTFYNELDLLEYRLNILNDTVDHFVLVESTKTHMGLDKPLYYSDNKERFSKFNDKIIHIIVEDLIIPNEEQLDNEKHQQNYIHVGIEQLNLSDYDYILISDVDEIPDPTIINMHKHSNTIIPFANLKQDVYQHNLNYKNNEVWVMPKIITHLEYVKHGSLPSKIRSYIAPSTIEKSGWRLSNFGGTNSIKHGVKLTKIPIKDNMYLPPNYETFLSMFIDDNMLTIFPVEEIDEDETISYEISEEETFIVNDIPHLFQIESITTNLEENEEVNDVNPVSILDTQMEM